MYIKVKNVPSPKGAWRFLEKNEVILKDDLVRSTVYSGFSESTDYEEIKTLNWQLAEDALPGWVGKSLRDFERFDPSYVSASHFEIIRKVKE